MDIFEADITHFDPRTPYAGDEKIPVKFRIDAQKDDTASEAAGRPIFRDVEFIQIFNSKDNIIDRPVRESDKQRWPRAYAAWKSSGESDPGATGTKLAHWPVMTRAQVEEFAYFKIYTVEQLAAMPDSVGGQMMGFQRLKALAQVNVEAAKGEAPFLKMRGELEKRDGEIAELRAEVARLSKLMQTATDLGVTKAA